MLVDQTFSSYYAIFSLLSFEVIGFFCIFFGDTFCLNTIKNSYLVRSLDVFYELFIFYFPLSSVNSLEIYVMHASVRYSLSGEHLLCVAFLLYFFKQIPTIEFLRRTSSTNFVTWQTRPCSRNLQFVLYKSKCF